MFRSCHSRRRSHNVLSASLQGESLETRQLMSADGSIGDCPPVQTDVQEAAMDQSAVSSSESDRADSASGQERSHNARGNESEKTDDAAPAIDFDALAALIQSTIDTESADNKSGAAVRRTDNPDLSLVTSRADAGTSGAVSDLLSQLRRLQSVQVTIDARFIALSDSFFEQSGIDFDFDPNDVLGDDSSSGGVVVHNDDSIGRVLGGGTAGDPLEHEDFDHLDGVNGSRAFDIGVPDFGGFDPEAGVQVGVAVLSDIEAFFFLQAAQGDRRTAVLSAPTITLADGEPVAHAGTDGQ